MVKGKKTLFTKYVDAYDFIKDNIPLESDGEDLETVLQMLDLIHEKDVSIRQALDMLKDARTIILEMVSA